MRDKPAQSRKFIEGAKKLSVSKSARVPFEEIVRKLQRLAKRKPKGGSR